MHVPNWLTRFSAALLRTLMLTYCLQNLILYMVDLVWFIPVAPTRSIGHP
jgi:hypothetical protein